jgi:hypothetical protein
MDPLERRVYLRILLPLAFFIGIFSVYLWPFVILRWIIQNYRHSQASGISDLSRRQLYLLENMSIYTQNGTLVPFLMYTGNSLIGISILFED